MKTSIAFLTSAIAIISSAGPSCKASYVDALSASIADIVTDSIIWGSSGDSASNAGSGSKNADSASNAGSASNADSASNAQSCPPNPLFPSGQLPETPNTHYPDLFLPVVKSTPNTAYPATNASFAVTPGDTCTFVQFTMDSNALQNKTLNLIFNFPDSSQGGQYWMDGPGHFEIGAVSPGQFPVPGNTTWNKQPHLFVDSLPTAPPVMTPGHSYLVTSNSTSDIPPNIGNIRSVGRICSRDTTFYYEQQDQQGAPGLCTMGFFFIVTE